AASPAEQLHAVGDDFGRKALLPFLVLPFARADAAFDVAGRTFFQILTGDFGELAEERDAVPFGVLLLLAAFVFPGIRRRDPYVGDCVTTRQIACFRICAQVAD